MNMISQAKEIAARQNSFPQMLPVALEPPASVRPDQTSPARARFEPVDLGLYNGLYEIGKQRALESGALVITPEDETPLIQHAQAMALDARRESFNTSEGADQLRAEEFTKRLTDRAETEIAEKHTTAALHAANEAVAEKKTGNPPNPPPRAFLMTAMIFIALTLAVTLHDQVFLFGDEITAWVCSALIGLLCGWFVTSLVMYSNGTEATASTLRRVGLIGGIAIGMGMFALRVAESRSVGSAIFALGMTILEVGAVIGLHSVAEHYRAALKEYRERELGAIQAEAARDVLQQRLGECRAKLAQLEADIQQHIQYIGERRLRQQHVAELEALAINGVRDGYAAGVALNVGRTRNVKVKKGGSR